jgi:hypothetical protein
MLQFGIEIKTLQILRGHKNIATKDLKALRLDDLRYKVEPSILVAMLWEADQTEPVWAAHFESRRNIVLGPVQRIATAKINGNPVCRFDTFYTRTKSQTES